MSDIYAKSIERIIMERERLELSVQQLSDLVCVDQSNWCKIEQGKGRISYKCLKRLCYVKNIDMYFILSGNRVAYCNYAELAECDMSDLVSLLRLIYSVSELRCRNASSNSWKDIYDNTKYILLVDAQRGMNGLLVNLRRLGGYSQKKIAEILGIDIKKWQNMEKGVNFPDNELLCRLWDKFKISPGIMLGDKRCLLNEVCFWLEKMITLDNEAVVHMLNLIKK